MIKYILCADGACSGNPGPGGYAYEIWDTDVADGQQILGGAGGLESTTNNIMELKAAIAGLKELIHSTHTPGLIQLRLDSQYVLKGMFEWLPGWKARGWKTASKKPVANQDLWADLDALMADASARGWTLEADWVEGHAGDLGNERVDAKAVEMRDAMKVSEAVSGCAYEPAQPIDLTQIAQASAPAVVPNQPQQIRLLRSLLDGYVNGRKGVGQVLSELRDNAEYLQIGR